MHSDLQTIQPNVLPAFLPIENLTDTIAPIVTVQTHRWHLQVPTPNVSAVDLTFESKSQTTAAEITAIMQDAANGEMNGIIDVIDEPLVSSDFNHDPHSSIFHSDQTLVMDGDMIRILAWYDNEWAFSNRMANTAVEMGKFI